MLLWVLILALFGGVVALLATRVPARLRANTLAVQGAITIAFLVFILAASNPFTRVEPGAARGPGPQPGPAGSRPRDPSAAALRRLCRLLDHLRLRHGGADRRPHRRGLGARRAALDARRLDLPHARHRDGLLLGLLRARLGRLVVLGPGRERLASCPGSPARRSSTPTVVMEKRDALKVWTILLAILTFSLSLLGTFLVRSGVLTSVHAFAVDPTRGVFILAILVALHRRLARALRLARAAAAAGRPVRAGLARGRARRQQPLPRHRLRHGLRRHALSAGARGADRREDLGRRAVLQLDLRADRGPAARCSCRSARRWPGSAAICSARRSG